MKFDRAALKFVIKVLSFLPFSLSQRINSFIIFTFPSITNVVRRCALQLLMSKQKTLDKQTLKEALQKETQKM